MEGEEELFDKPGWLTEMPYWAVSAILHIILILIIGGLVLSQQVTKAQKKVDMVAKLKKEQPKYDPKKKRDLKRTPKIPNPKIIPLDGTFILPSPCTVLGRLRHNVAILRDSNSPGAIIRLSKAQYSGFSLLPKGICYKKYRNRMERRRSQRSGL